GKLYYLCLAESEYIAQSYLSIYDSKTLRIEGPYTVNAVYMGPNRATLAYGQAMQDDPQYIIVRGSKFTYTIDLSKISSTASEISGVLKVAVPAPKSCTGDCNDPNTTSVVVIATAIPAVIIGLYCLYFFVRKVKRASKVIEEERRINDIPLAPSAPILDESYVPSASTSASASALASASASMTVRVHPAPPPYSATPSN
ncbi:hypothetical protein BG003_001217, partial [Podila horticola]